ncbi:sulfotransferase [Aliiglaciecola sp. 3_MG-2023]|uniref:tetratricopeptide repeat-containing sulfotransferase family protein n=1 Tax=Aliiglaciecola sp. 3_MG-2023 TaxID=3062644 RepID=UPI0026E1E0A4|nr:tetratricopeptide repeat-containing sulfotransferase family protein [Aliiglaciecola sp. 3_MG-2023]MDO6693796.1 sulfotransferase [Aliiglaciecola sp. 3_MG-2023]
MNNHIRSGNDYLTKGDLINAQNVFVQLLKSEPNNGMGYLGLGKVAKAAFQYDQAINLLQKACHLLDKQPEPLLELADAFSVVHAPEDAQTVLRYAYENCPQDKAVHSALVQHYISTAQNTQALPLLRSQITSTDPVFAAYGWLDLIRIQGQPLSNDQWQLIHISYQSSTANSHHRMLLDYALGQAYDKQKNYSQAIEYLQKANAYQLTLCTYRTEQMSDFFSTLRACYQKVSFAKDSANPLRNRVTPVFILGLPRTGSTLLEQLLCQHTEVATCGEKAYLSQFSVPYLEKMTQLAYPHLASKLAELDTSKVSEHYIKLLSMGLNEPFIINKLPANFQNIGLIYQLFTNAKVIHVTRNIKDVSVSIFKNYFAENEPYFCDLDEFSKYVSLYKKQMQFWEALLPNSILTVKYEDLAAEPKQVINKVLKYIGLEWQDSCVTAMDGKGTINTLSAAQVRKPIHNKSIGQWQNYQGLFN